MAEYDNMDNAFEGMLYGVANYNRIEGGWAAAEAGGIGFGKPAFAYVGDEKNLYNYLNDTAKIVFDADFVASNLINATVNGVSIAEVTFTTDHDTTAELLVAAFAALDGVKCILDSNDANNRTFLVQSKGLANTSTAVVTAGASQAVATITYDSSQVYVGTTCSVQNSLGYYEQYDAVNVVAEGEVWVVPVLAVQAQESAYVDGAGADIGAFTDSTGVAVAATYRSSGVADALVRLYTEGHTNMTYAGLF
jgi:hypothetical protein